MSPEGDPAGSAESPVTSSGVDTLIERLRLQGVEAGLEAKELIAAEAERDAEKLLSEARDRAAEMVEKGRAEAESLRTSGEDALRVAMRDAVLRMRETLRKRLEEQVRLLVSEQMVDHEFLRKLIIEVAQRARDDSGVAEAEAIEMLLPQEVVGLDELRQHPEERDSKLGRFAKEIASATWREGVTIDTLESGGRGIRVRFQDGELELDLSDRAIADQLLEHLQPRFRMVMEGLDW